MDFSFARLRWLGFRRSYLIEVGKVYCRKCGRIFPIDERTIQRSLTKAAGQLKGDLLDDTLGVYERKRVHVPIEAHS
jgi:hypothetical protein